MSPRISFESRSESPSFLDRKENSPYLGHVGQPNRDRRNNYNMDRSIIYTLDHSNLACSFSFSALWPRQAARSHGAGSSRRMISAIMDGVLDSHVTTRLFSLPSNTPWVGGRGVSFPSNSHGFRSLSIEMSYPNSSKQQG